MRLQVSKGRGLRDRPHPHPIVEEGSPGPSGRRLIEEEHSGVVVTVQEAEVLHSIDLL